MSNKEQIERYRDTSQWFLEKLATQVIILGERNWRGLEEHVHNEQILPILGGLTHIDVSDGPNLWPAIKDEETLLKFVVMNEGFNQGAGQIRDKIANSMGETLYLSRKNSTPSELRNISKQRISNSAVVMYLTGTKKLFSPLKPGIQSIMKKDDLVYPFVNLSDTLPALPSGSSFAKNLWELFLRTTINKQESQNFLYLMKPITKSKLLLMREGNTGKEGKFEIMEKLEVLRAFGVLKTMIEVAKMGTSAVNPLLNNSDNLPFFINCQNVLLEESDRVRWLASNGYFSLREISLLLSLPIIYDEK